MRSVVVEEGAELERSEFTGSLLSPPHLWLRLVTQGYISRYQHSTLKSPTVCGRVALWVMKALRRKNNAGNNKRQYLWFSKSFLWDLEMAEIVSWCLSRCAHCSCSLEKVFFPWRKHSSRESKRLSLGTSSG